MRGTVRWLRTGLRVAPSFLLQAPRQKPESESRRGVPAAALGLRGAERRRKARHVHAHVDVRRAYVAQIRWAVCDYAPPCFGVLHAHAAWAGQAAPYVAQSVHGQVRAQGRHVAARSVCGDRRGDQRDDDPQVLSDAIAMRGVVALAHARATPSVWRWAVLAWHGRAGVRQGGMARLGRYLYGQNSIQRQRKRFIDDEKVSCNMQRTAGNMKRCNSQWTRVSSTTRRCGSGGAGCATVVQRTSTSYRTQHSMQRTRASSVDHYHAKGWRCGSHPVQRIRQHTTCNGYHPDADLLRTPLARWFQAPCRAALRCTGLTVLLGAATATAAPGGGSRQVQVEEGGEYCAVPTRARRAVPSGTVRQRCGTVASALLWVCRSLRSLPYPSIPQRAWLTAAARAYATAHRRQPRRFP